MVHTTDELPLDAVEADVAEADVPGVDVGLLPLEHAAAPRQSAPASADVTTPFAVPTDFAFIRTPKT